MNLGRHFSVLWRFKLVMFGGIVLGTGLAILAAFHVPDMTRRGSEEWQSQSDVLVTQKGFPWGRVTLPEQSITPAAAEALEAAGQEVPKPKESKGNDLPFADPGRFSQLALLYARIANSDEVRSMLSKRYKPEQIQAYAVDATGNGSNFLPMIKITTTDTSSAAAAKLNQDAFNAFQKLLKRQQAESDIPDNERVFLSVLNKGDRPILLSGRSKTPSIMAFLLCIILAVAVAHILASLRPRPGDEKRDDDDDSNGRRQPSLVERPATVVQARPASGSWSSAPGGSSALAGQRRSS